MTRPRCAGLYKCVLSRSALTLTRHSASRLPPPGRCAGTRTCPSVPWLCPGPASRARSSCRSTAPTFARSRDHRVRARTCCPPSLGRARGHRDRAECPPRPGGTACCCAWRGWCPRPRPRPRARRGSQAQDRQEATPPHPRRQRSHRSGRRARRRCPPEYRASGRRRCQCFAASSC